MAAKKDDTIEVLSAEDVASFTGLVRDLKAERTIPENSTWTYLVKITPLNGTYIGAWLHVDGPLVAHSSGSAPAFRKYIYTDADWKEERVFNTIGDLYIFLRTLCPLFRRVPYRLADGAYIADPISIVDLSGWRS